MLHKRLADLLDLLPLFGRCALPNPPDRLIFLGRIPYKRRDVGFQGGGDGLYYGLRVILLTVFDPVYVGGRRFNLFRKLILSQPPEFPPFFNMVSAPPESVDFE
jgi:hypothetical protein